MLGPGGHGAARQQVRELQRLLGGKTPETGILRQAMERVAAARKLPWRATSWPEGGRRARWRRRSPAPDAGLPAAIRMLTADLPTDGRRRVHALPRRRAGREGRSPPNVKRVCRVMKLPGLPLQRQAGGAEACRHEGKAAVTARTTRRCPDGLGIAAENGERVRVTCALGCCDREATSFVATTAGMTGEDVRDLMVAAVDHRSGRVDRLPALIAG